MHAFHRHRLRFRRDGAPESGDKNEGWHFVLQTEYSLDVAILAEKAEDLGFESFWVAEHPVMPVNTPSSPYRGSPDGVIPDSFGRLVDPFVALARASAVTQTIRLGTAVCLVPERNPLLLAKEIATLDHFSGGRFTFWHRSGLGQGGNRDYGGRLPSPLDPDPGGRPGDEGAVDQGGGRVPWQVLRLSDGPLLPQTGSETSPSHLARDSPDQTNFPGYSSFWDTVNYNPAFQGRQMRPNSLKFPVFI